MSKIDHHQQIDDLIHNHKIFVFMKGDPQLPQCGFSALTVAILKKFHVAFGTFDVLRDPVMRQAVKDFTDWPTIPQVFIDGKFIGGSDILQELYESGELKKLIETV